MQQCDEACCFSHASQASTVCCEVGADGGGRAGPCSPPVAAAAGGAGGGAAAVVVACGAGGVTPELHQLGRCCACAV